MSIKIQIGLIGDCSSTVRAHTAIPMSVSLASGELGIDCSIKWIPTESLINSINDASDVDGLWCVPGSPYNSMQGALNGIKFARENKIPFLGTCGGFQHTVIEYVRNVLEITEADHAESNPYAAIKIIYPLVCSLVGTNGKILFEKESMISSIYNDTEANEEYHCSYGLNPEFEYLFSNSEFKITGRNANSEVRVLEHLNHPFMIAALFQPELSSFKNVVHPIIKSYLMAVVKNKK